MEKKIGLTKETGWQFGIRKSVGLNVNEVWNFLFSDSETKLWLNGVDKDFSTIKDYSHIRTKWQLKGWTNKATLQMRVLANKDKTTISFHIDKLLDENQREETKTYWTKILNEITKKLNDKATNS